MPRCEVSIASATPNPCAHRCSRKRIVDSQSMTGIPPPCRGGGGHVRGGEDLAAGRRRVPAAQPGSGMTSGPARTPGSWISQSVAGTSDRQRRHVEPPAFGRGLQRQVGQLHPLGSLDQVPGERPALGQAHFRNSSHSTLNPLSKVMLSGTSDHSAW